jgi:hypothetical protein
MKNNNISIFYRKLFMSAAAESRPHPVCEIFIGRGFFLIKPTRQGEKLFGSTNIVDPTHKAKVDIEVELITKGKKRWDPKEHDYTKMRLKDRELVEPSVEDNYETPPLASGLDYMYVVYSNHPVLDYLIAEYKRQLPSSEVYQENAMANIQDLESYKYGMNPRFTSFWHDSRYDLSKRSISVDRKVKLFTKGKSKKTPGAGAAEGGGARRRPSRKYKKSKRVLRRKSRATRRH